MSGGSARTMQATSGLSSSPATAPVATAPAAPVATPAAPGPGPRCILLCVVVGPRQEVSLACARSLLRLQALLMVSPVPVLADMHFVGSVNEALTALLRHPDATGLALVDASIAMDPAFPLRAMDSGLPVVTGCYAVPGVDWERVKRCAAEKSDEDPAHWGNTYSVTPATPEDRRGPYVRVDDAKLGLVWVRREVVLDVAKRHPEVVGRDGSAAALALEGVYDGVHRTADRRFLDLLGDDVTVWADLDGPATSTGLVEFGGCVGLRSVLR